MLMVTTQTYHGFLTIATILKFFGAIHFGREGLWFVTISSQPKNFIYLIIR